MKNILIFIFKVRRSLQSKKKIKKAVCEDHVIPSVCDPL